MNAALKKATFVPAKPSLLSSIVGNHRLVNFSLWLCNRIEFTFAILISFNNPICHIFKGFLILDQLQYSMNEIEIEFLLEELHFKIIWWKY